MLSIRIRTWIPCFGMDWEPLSRYIPVGCSDRGANIKSKCTVTQRQQSMKRSFSHSFQGESIADDLKDLAVLTSSISTGTGISTPLSSSSTNSTLDPYPYALNDCDHLKRRRRTSSILRVQSLSLPTPTLTSYNLVNLDVTTSSTSIHNLDLDLDLDNHLIPQDLPFSSWTNKSRIDAQRSQTSSRADYRRWNGPGSFPALLSSTLFYQCKSKSKSQFRKACSKNGSFSPPRARGRTWKPIGESI